MNDMTIDRHNIEAYLLDYFEGRLDPVLSAELMAFLAENPEYDIMMSDSETLFSGADHFGDTARLKKDFADIPEISDANFGEFCIAAAEGLLTPPDKLRLEIWLEKNPDRQPEYRLYCMTKLQPDRTIVFPGKASLKKAGSHVVLFRSAWVLLGLAASITLFMLLYHPPSVTVPAKNPFAAQPLPITPALQSPASVHAEVPAEPVSHITTAPPELAGATRPVETREPLAPRVMREARITAALPAPVLSIRSVPAGSLSVDRQPASSMPDRESLLPSMADALFRNVNFWKAAETAVSGFNYLTESQVAISRTVDESGRPVALTLDTEQFMITGNKVK